MQLVSVIVPCYNAARWVAEAVESCLMQSYAPIEIIVVNDGSTDESSAILRSYGDRIRLIQQAHAGGNRARNHGFALSRGEFIQFLDADDYILPDKIARQVAFLQDTGADVVYGDWCHQMHNPDDTSYMSEVAVSGAHSDVLEALLRGWWVPPNTLLFRRQTALTAGPWDEALQAAQDRDFFTTVALQGADIRYLAGCDSVYRRYGNVTVSTSNRLRWLENQCVVLEKAERALVANGHWSERYQQALARSYFHLARNYYERDQAKYRSLMSKVLTLDPGFLPDESMLYNRTCRLIGFERSERLALIWRRLRTYGEVAT